MCVSLKGIWDENRITIVSLSHPTQSWSAYESINALKFRFARIVRAVSAFEGSKENITDAKMIKRKLMPPVESKTPESTTTTQSETSPAKGGRSSSKLDFDGKVDTFGNLIQLVQGLPAYNPNEADLKVTALKAQLLDLQTKNQNVIKAANALSQARIARDKVLYGSNGVYENGTAAKEYIRAVFGVRSEAARQIGQVRLIN